MKLLLSCLSLFLAFNFASIANCDISYNEASDGDLAPPENPTVLGLAGFGGNTVTGTLDNAVNVDPDAFIFTIAPGMQLNTLTFTSMSGINDHFLAFNDGPLSTTDPAGNLISTLIAASDVGTNILDGSLNLYGGSGLSGQPLGPGDYYLWFQETDGMDVSYSISFTTSAIPEPTSAGLVCLAGLLSAIRRRRRSQISK